MRTVNLAVLLFLFRLVQTLEVTPNSGCSPLCDENISNGANFGDDGNSYTLGRDVICDDYELDGANSTVRGRKWKSCLTCEINSTATDSHTNQNEVYWVLFNLKFSIDWCVFAYPDNANRTAANVRCADVCSGPGGNAKLALVDRLLQTNATIQYEYCNDGDGAFSKVADDCAKCLEQVPNAKTLVNYVHVLKAGCDQQPKPGETLKLDFDLFPATSASNAATSGASTVTVTTSPSSLTAFLVSSASAAVASASFASSAKKSHNNRVQTGVGVGVGVGGLAVSLAVVVILWRRRSARKRIEWEKESHARWEAEYQARQGGQSHAKDHPFSSELGGSSPFVAEVDDERSKGVELDTMETTARGMSGTLKKHSGTGRFIHERGEAESPDQAVVRT